MSGSVLSLSRPAAATNGHNLLAKQINCNGNGTSGGAAKTTVASAITPPKQPQLAAKVIQQSQIVCFDVDSTVICEEGIDEGQTDLTRLLVAHSCSSSTTTGMA